MVSVVSFILFLLHTFMWHVLTGEFSSSHVCIAAYQVGLSFLTTHMRRAVAACTSPEVFFGNANAGDAPVQIREGTPTDALALAMQTLSMSSGTV